MPNEAATVAGVFGLVWIVGVAVGFVRGARRFVHPPWVMCYGGLATLGYWGCAISLTAQAIESDLRTGSYGLVGMFLASVGGFVRVWSMYLNRHFFAGWTTAPDHLCRRGPYRIVPHPGYVGAALMVIGAVAVDSGQSIVRIIAAMSAISGYVGLGLYESQLIRQGRMPDDE